MRLSELCVRRGAIAFEEAEPLSARMMKATGRVVHQSRNLLIADAELLDSGGRQLARDTGTFMRSKILLSADIGYL